MAFDRNLNIRVRWVLHPPPDIQKALGAASKGVMLDPFGPGFQQALTRAVDGMNTFGAAIGKVNALLEKLGGVGAKGARDHKAATDEAASAEEKLTRAIER